MNIIIIFRKIKRKKYIEGQLKNKEDIKIRGALLIFSEIFIIIKANILAENFK